MHQVQSPADLPIRSGRAHTPRRDPQAAGEEIPLRVLGNSERNGNAIAMDLAKGAVAGAVAWWAMDQTLRLLYDHEGPAVREQEDWARGGVPFEAFCEVATRMGRPVERMVRGHDHVEERFAVFPSWVANPVLTINAMSHRLPREVFGP
jgi:hypothetical protein